MSEEIEVEEVEIMPADVGGNKGSADNDDDEEEEEQNLCCVC